MSTPSFQRAARDTAVPPVVVAAVVTVALAGCAGGSSQIVTRVGTVPITQATLTHWMRAMAPRHVLPNTPDEALRRQALSFLISSQWLIGEAAAEGIGVTKAQVAQRLAEKERPFPGGRHEFEGFLGAVARTVADQELEIQVELASEAIRRKLAAEGTRITPAEVADHYRQHLAEYRVPEERYYEIVENIQSAKLARKLRNEVESGRSMATLGGPEAYPRKKSFSSYPGENPTVIEAIFKAAPHVLTGPIKGGPYYFLIEITRITPGFMQSFSQVRGAIASRLAAEQPQRRLAAFTASWRSTWKARTSCRPGYVVRECRQYSGPDGPEASLPLG
jgi:foldase protein PrsA